jgi:hypothetical protein
VRGFDRRGPELGQLFDVAGGSEKPRIGQIALSCDPDQGIVVKLAMDLFRWFTDS